MSDSDPRLQPSLLARLTDSDSEGTSWRRGYELDDLIEAVQGDLQDLLNTPRVYPDIPAAFEKTRDSVAGYGLPEVVSRSANTPEAQERIRTLLQDTVSRFEPRLKDVWAEVISGEGAPRSQLRVRIKARLCMDPAPEVAFDTILELTTGQCSVNASE
jgi:type VI secretion system protein ImpF